MYSRRMHIVWIGIAMLLGGLAPSRAQEPTTANTITVSLVPDPVGGRNLLLTVAANEVNDLYGLGFDLSFPKKRLRWKKNSKRSGTLLSADDTVETVVLDRQKPRGHLHVGASRLGEVEGVTGSGVLLEIGFVNRKKAGPRDLALIEPEAFDSNTEPIEGIVWTVAPFDDESGS